MSKAPLQAQALIAPQQTTVTVGSSGTLVVSAIGGQRGYSPGEMLLGALASCMALSLKFAVKEAGVVDRAGEVSVQVIGTKSDTGPSRFIDIAVNITFAGNALTEAEKQTLVARAEDVCTVSNSLHTPPTITKILSD